MSIFKKHVSIPGLLKKTKESFEKIPDRKNLTKISLADCLQSGLAIFGLKFASLLQFDQGRNDEIICNNLKNLYGVKNIPCDTQMRKRLDELEPSMLRPTFKKLFAALQRQKALESYDYYNGHYLLAVDGTGVFSSSKIHCESCCVKNHKDGSQTYYHQMLAAVIVHSEKKGVIPLCPEAITKQDGETKNDCERNAAKRLLEATRREHPHLKLIVVEDGLASNGPHIELLQKLDMRYILGAKESDHKSLFDFYHSVWSEKYQKQEQDKNGMQHHYRWVNQVPLNDSHPNLLVNFLEYWEISSKGKKQYFTWVTDIPLSESTVRLVMKGGRARWHIENETFNTLKNQGYQFEHNFGHGDKNLCTVFAMLMFLAFLIDQIQEICCDFFNEALKKAKRKLYFWQKLRFLFQEISFLSWEHFYQVIAKKIPLYVNLSDTS